MAHRTGSPVAAKTRYCNPWVLMGYSSLIELVRKEMSGPSFAVLSLYYQREALSALEGIYGSNRRSGRGQGAILQVKPERNGSDHRPPPDRRLGSGRESP